MVVDSGVKEGGRMGCSFALNYLKNMLYDLGVIDLDFSGNKFTWSKKRWGWNCITLRLGGGKGIEWNGMEKKKKNILRIFSYFSCLEI